jgi:hypothetical protein
MNSTPVGRLEAKKLLTAAPLSDEDEARALAYLPVVEVDICKGVGDRQ